VKPGVLIVDDDPLVRSGLTMMLGGAHGVEVVGEAADGSEVLAALDRHRADVVLMDLRMPKVDGIAAMELVRRQPQPPAVLVLTTFDTDDQVLPASWSRTHRRPRSCARSSWSRRGRACSRRPSPAG
jgi:DNA-binding NarL/FixJ family response regulator